MQRMNMAVLQVLVMTVAVVSCSAIAFSQTGSAPESPALKLTMEVDFGQDVGQNFGTLFEATDPQGRVVAGAGFQGLYNTVARSDRRTLQFFVRPANDAGQVTLERLPRFSEDTGVYLFDMNGRLFAQPKYVERRVMTWEPTSGRWEAAPEPANTALRGGDGSMHLGEGRLTFIQGTISYNGKPILVPPQNETFHHVYYALGHLFFFHDRAGDAKDGAFTRICACPWTPDQASADLARAIVQPLPTPHETTWAFGQIKGKVLTVSNKGGVYCFDGAAWKTLRAPDGKSYQVYSMLNYYDRLLLGQYPSGCLFEFDGEEVKPRESWPPPIPGVSRHAREAQAMALYRGDLYAGVWPWAELWRYDRNTKQWTAIGRVFTRPPVTDQVAHPFEAEIKAYNAAHGKNNVINDWGQRLTSLAVAGDTLYAGTCNKGGTPRPADYTFIDDAMLKEYGQVQRLRRPGHLCGQVRWVKGPTPFQFLVAGGQMRLAQDGRELASTRLDPSLAAGLKDAKITWGNGMFGPLEGKIRATSED